MVTTLPSLAVAVRVVMILGGAVVVGSPRLFVVETKTGLEKVVLSRESDGTDRLKESTHVDGAWLSIEVGITVGVKEELVVGGRREDEEVEETVGVVVVDVVVVVSVVVVLDADEDEDEDEDEDALDVLVLVVVDEVDMVVRVEVEVDDDVGGIEEVYETRDEDASEDEET
jgi:hypothetical protein